MSDDGRLTEAGGLPDGRKLSDGGRGGLAEAIRVAGYYPEVVADAVEIALGREVVAEWLVHHEPTLDRDGVFRHLTVLALTPSRLVLVHVDEHEADETVTVPYATTSTETVPLHRISSVVVDRVVARPATYVRGSMPLEVVLSVGWGGGQLELSPAGCADPDCDADHGYTGTLESEDFSVRVSAAGDGTAAIEQALRFARALSVVSVGPPAPVPAHH